jgi:signal transduction histidine kinase
MAVTSRPAGPGPDQTSTRSEVQQAVDHAFEAAHSQQTSHQPVGDHTRLTAHEMRSHLAVLNGYLSMLAEGAGGDLPERAQPFLTEMRAKAHALSQLVEDMLEDARFQDGQVHLSKRLVDLREVTRASVREARSGLALNYNVHYAEPRDPVLVEADPSRIATILRNLLDNAMKYSPDGGTIECRLEAGPREAVITVADEGVGLDQAEVPRLFQRFGRGKDRAAIGGVGLGLYICRTLAELHGGTIDAEPRIPKGSLFVVRLPLHTTHR